MKTLFIFFTITLLSSAAIQADMGLGGMLCLFLMLHINTFLPGVLPLVLLVFLLALHDVFASSLLVFANSLLVVFAF
jgi:hypothetical protein